jgi:hypothetical protein
MAPARDSRSTATGDSPEEALIHTPERHSALVAVVEVRAESGRFRRPAAVCPPRWRLSCHSGSGEGTQRWW